MYSQSGRSKACEPSPSTDPDTGDELAVRDNVEPLSDRYEIPMKLITARVHGRPVGIQGKAVSAKVAGNVTSTSRIAVMPPYAADVVRLLVDSEVIVSKKTFELSGHTKA
jgi:hypothetical protein